MAMSPLPSAARFRSAAWISFSGTLIVTGSATPERMMIRLSVRV